MYLVHLFFYPHIYRLKSRICYDVKREKTDQEKELQLILLQIVKLEKSLIWKKWIWQWVELTLSMRRIGKKAMGVYTKCWPLASRTLKSKNKYWALNHNSQTEQFVGDKNKRLEL